MRTGKDSAGFAMTAIGAALGLATVAQAGEHRSPKQTELEETRMIIEFNSSAEDIGIQFFVDGEGWREIEISDPRGREIFSAEAEGRLLKQGGGTELFLESVEPPLDELPLEKFFDRFPEGTYKFRGRSPDGGKLVGEAEFTHDVPAGPVIVTPVPVGGAECAVDAPIPTVIKWDPVTTSIFDDPLEIAGYEVIVEGDDINYDVHLPAEVGTMVTVTPELLQPGGDYRFEVLAIEEGGNQTITEGCFRTAD
jgi:hypothetical protein